MAQYTDNPIADYDAYCREQERYVKRLPVCEDCGQHIEDDEAYEFGGAWYCEDCAEKHRKKVNPA